MPRTPHLGLLACLAGGMLACAGTGASTSGAPERAEGQRELLAKTTPQAAARAEVEESSERGVATPIEPSDEATPGRLLVYSAITGHVPLEERSAYDPADRYRSPEEREAARARAIESEIEEELARQEAIQAEETSRTQVSGVAPPAPEPHELTDDPRSTPAAPELKTVPESLFASRELTIPAGQWQNPHDLRVVQRSLDVDEDGAPEEVRYLDAATGVLLRSERDRDFDGRLDASISYQRGEPAVQVLDENGDGASDAWERYRDGRLETRTVDSDHDGVKDTFYRYGGDGLEEKLRDANNDATIDRVEVFVERRRVRVEEDLSLNGELDTWTHYEPVDGQDRIARIERDSRDSGKPDVFEVYETVGGSTRLVRKEEDVDGDGSIDIVSTYAEGKLVQRAISDEALSPL